MKDIIPLSPADTERTVGITTTVPVEVIFAAGLRPLDLNNVFITADNPARLVEEAERAGFPLNSCAWNKGIYATARRLGLRRVVGVVQGDCANTHAMMEMLRADGVEVIPFAYPYDPADDVLMELALDRFASQFGTSRAEAEQLKARLDEARSLALRIDEAAWQGNVVSGEELHLWTISCSDFLGDPARYAEQAGRVLKEAATRQPDTHSLRLALVGIPPICEGLFAFLEEHDARVVFDEVPRQFAMPYKTASLAEQYARYTYPYDVFHRLPDIAEQTEQRRVDGIIHYVQSFCFRQVQDAIIRRRLAIPILTLECDRPGPLDMRTETRIEAFLEMFHENAAHGQ